MISNNIKAIILLMGILRKLFFSFIILVNYSLSQSYLNKIKLYYIIFN